MATGTLQRAITGGASDFAAPPGGKRRRKSERTQTRGSLERRRRTAIEHVTAYRSYIQTAGREWCVKNILPAYATRARRQRLQHIRGNRELLGIHGNKALERDVDSQCGSGRTINV